MSMGPPLGCPGCRWPNALYAHDQDCTARTRPGSPLVRAPSKLDQHAYGRATLRNALYIESEAPGHGHGVRYLMRCASPMFDVDGLDDLRARIRAAQAAPDVHDEESLVALMEAELVRMDSERGARS